MILQTNNTIFTSASIGGNIAEPQYISDFDIKVWDNKNKKYFKFAPKEDITTFELAKFIQMLTYISTISNRNSLHYVQADVKTFLEKNGIERHFTESE